MATRLHLPAAVRRELAGWVEAGYPHETCGLLVGRQEGDAVRVTRATQARNLNTDRAHDRYELDPEDQLAADLAARAEGLDLVGVWHSHPDHPARPSETDRAKAWEGWSYVIAAVTARGVTDLRSWRLGPDAQFTEEPVEAGEEEAA